MWHVKALVPLLLVFLLLLLENDSWSGLREHGCRLIYQSMATYQWWQPWKNWFPLPRLHQPIAPQVGVWPPKPSPVYYGRFTGSVLHRSCVSNHSYFEFMSTMAMWGPKDTLLCSTSHPLPYVLSAPSFTMFLKPWRGDADILFQAMYLVVTYF